MTAEATVDRRLRAEGATVKDNTKKKQNNKKTKKIKKLLENK